MKKAWMVLVGMLSGCSTMQMKAADLRTLGPEEGRVFGSVAIIAEPVAKDEFVLAALTGPQSAGATCSIKLAHDVTISLPTDTTYSMDVTSAKVEVFRMKLPAGSYRFAEITTHGMKAELGARFTVAAGKTSYVGRLDIMLPPRLTEWTGLTLGVVDAQAEDTASLGAEFADVLAKPVKALMQPR